jgi:NAD(P)-dependent dehydrogenase (short-subunit alcohol dehydrogenase family)
MTAGLLEGKVAVVTGASRGLGFAIARRFLQAGAQLAICARDRTELDVACGRLLALGGEHPSVLARDADVSQPSDVERLFATTLTHFGHIDILVNNAGMLGPAGPIESLDWKAWVQTIETNLFGPVLTCRAVLPHLKAAGRGKIIQLSGGGATHPLPLLSAYGVGKAAVIRLVETLAEEVRELRIDVNAIAPGALNTRMLEQILQAGPERVGPAFHARAVAQKENGGTSIERAADLAVFLGSSLSDGISGKLISAIWDPWERLTEHREELSRSDVYTLRRIVPKDRGFTWGELP